MNPVTYAAFVNELEKIAIQGPFEMNDQHAVANSALYPLEQEGKNRDFRQTMPPGGKESKVLPRNQAARLQADSKESPPAREANNLFGLPLGLPRKRGVRSYDTGSSAAASPDRSQTPTDAQSTANIAAGNTMSPATGPGGV
jgi:hypothetical protein